MPIDYKKYPSNWVTEIRPRIMKRANNTCEFEGCTFKHKEIVWSVKNGNVRKWFRNYDDAFKVDPNPKQVKVILTVAHLDHDESNPNVLDDRLKAACQLCHLRYDAKEKQKRLKNENSRT